MAKQANFPIAYRQGNGASLGIRGQNPTKPLRTRFTTVDFPYHWGPGTVEQWLLARGWKDLSALNPPKYKTQGWLFSGNPPEESKGQDLHVYHVGDKQVGVRKWAVGPPKVSEERTLRKPAPWMRADKTPDANVGAEQSAQAKEREKNKAPPNEQRSNPKTRRTDEAGTAVTGSTEAKDGFEDAIETPLVIQSQRTPAQQCTIPTWKGPEGLEVEDWHGNGDCRLNGLVAAGNRACGKARADVAVTLEKNKE